MRFGTSRAALALLPPRPSPRIPRLPMISAFVRLLKPLFLPLLRLKLEPPHLPEGVTLVRHLRPAEPWLGLKYAGVVFGFSLQLLALSAALVALAVAGKTQGEVVI